MVNLEKDAAAQGVLSHSRRTALVACVGIGLLLGWMVALLMRGGVASGPFFGERSLSFDSFYQAASLVMALCCFAYCLPVRFIGRFLCSRWCVPFICSLFACSAISTLILGTVPIENTALCYMLGVAVGFALAVFLALWLIVLTSFDPLETVRILLFDMAIAVGLFFSVHFVQKILHHPVLTTLFSLLLLTGSVSLLARCRTLFSDVQMSSEKKSPLLARLTVFAFMTAFAVEYAGAFAVVRGQGFFQGTYNHFLYQAVSSLFCIILSVFLAMFLHRAGGRGNSVTMLLYRLIALFLTVGIVLAAYSDGAFFIADAVLLFTRFFVLMGTWIIALHAAFLYGRDILGLIGSMLAAQFLGFFAGSALCEAVHSTFFHPLVPEIVLFLSLIVVVAVVLFVFTETIAGATGKIAAEKGLGGMSTDNRCGIAREKFGLTERETDVLRLLASGRNAVSIQEMLCVSYNTVKSHKRSIYTKMGVHSQQELLSLMDDLM